MEYDLAVFKSRTQTLRFYERCKVLRIPAEVVNTPRQASLGCGLSVKFPHAALPAVRRLLGMDNYYSFGGLFSLGPRGSVRPLRA